MGWWLEQEPGCRIDDRGDVARGPAFGRLVARRLALLRAIPILLIMVGPAAGRTLRLLPSESRRRSPYEKNRGEDQLPLHAAYVTTRRMNNK